MEPNDSRHHKISEIRKLGRQIEALTTMVQQMAAPNGRSDCRIH